MGANSTTLVLVRHGCTSGANSRARLNGWTDCPLSEKGIEQAQRAASRLRRDGPFACVYSSPLQRALATAKPIGSALHTALVVEDGLREIHCGALDGGEVAEVQQRFPRVWAANVEQTNEDFRWPGGESYREFRERCIDTITAIAERHSEQRVVVVTHAGVVNQLLGYLSGVCAARWEPYRPRNATITQFEWLGRRGHLVSFDDDRHLLSDRTQPESVTTTKVRRPDV